MARPSKFTQKLADEICGLLVEGNSLRAICRDDKMPHVGTVMRWLTEGDKAAFHEQYAHAREAQADALFDEILEIADGTRSELDGKDADVQRDRLAVDARKWMAGKLKGKYSDRNDLNVNARVEFSGLQINVKD